MADPVDSLKSKARELLPALRSELGDLATDVVDDHLLKFLYWKPDVSRAAGRFRAHLDWRRKNPGLFDDGLRISKDPELERILKSEVVISPPQCRTKSGGPLLIGRLRNNDMTDGRTPLDVCRMLFYTIDRVLEDPEAQLQGVTIVHDLRGFDRSRNVHIEIPKTLFGGIIGNFPIRIRAIYLMDPPWGFGAFFSAISMLLFPKKLRSRIHMVHNASDKAKVYEDVELSMLLKEMGGEVDFNIEQWIQEHKERELDGTFVSLTDIIEK